MIKQISMTTAMAAALIALSGCGSRNDDLWADDDTAICVDREGNRVDDNQCEPNGYRSGHRSSGSSGFLWYYVGRSSRMPYYGESIRDSRFAGGSYDPRPGGYYNRAPTYSNMTRSAAASRGGFGSSSRSYGSSGRS